MIFKHEIKRKCESPDHERMAAYLHQEFERLIETTPELTKRRSFGPKGWHLRDKLSKSQANGKEPEALFREFESHDITPTELSRMHFVSTDGVKSERYDTYAYYWFGDEVRLQVEGPNRIVVDGIGAAFERIAKTMESGALPKVKTAAVTVPAHVQEVSGPPASSAPVSSAPPMAGKVELKESWMAKTWRTHTVGAVISLVVTVLGAGIAAFFGFN